MSLSAEFENAILIHIAQDKVDEAWKHVSNFVRRGITKGLKGRMTAADLRLQVAAGEMDMWLVVLGDRVKAALFTNFINYPRQRVCNIVFIAGQDRKHWLHLLNDLERWAVAQGAQLMQIAARTGWLPDLPDYQKTHVMLAKEIGNG